MASPMETPSDLRLLLAVLAPLVGAGLVMATGKKPNLREACSFLAAVTLFLVVASMIPASAPGRRCTSRSSSCCRA